MTTASGREKERHGNWEMGNAGDTETRRQGDIEIV